MGAIYRVSFLPQNLMNKAEILKILRQNISYKIEKLEQLIAETRASNNDTKSSMGDKYETGREMLQQEINNLQTQLNEVVNQKLVLDKISEKNCEKVESGALVKTKTGLFYISVSTGEVIFDGQKIMAVSAESPLAKATAGKRESESFELMGKLQSIEKIW